MCLCLQEGGGWLVVFVVVVVRSIDDLTGCRQTLRPRRGVLTSTWKPLLALCPPPGHVRCLKHYYVCDARARLGNVACGASLDTNTHTYADALESLGRWANSRCRAAAAAASVVRWCRTRRERGPGCLRCSGSEPPTEPSERNETVQVSFFLSVFIVFRFFFFCFL